MHTRHRTGHVTVLTSEERSSILRNSFPLVGAFHVWDSIGPRGRGQANATAWDKTFLKIVCQMKAG